ncbi:unnamed protein product [Moneuplotes crassus]|uniref:Uncharacterized protein n=1 Tax=Euplotes crassus TaxID=5936 RepID=A0AAD1XMC6_EUPCR|nr:unnamed protein product [Moneuplotes crassus]
MFSQNSKPCSLNPGACSNSSASLLECCSGSPSIARLPSISSALSLSSLRSSSRWNELKCAKLSTERLTNSLISTHRLSNSAHFCSKLG